MKGASVRYGIDLMNFADYVDPRVLVELATTAEAAGWEALFLWDHLGFAWGSPSGDPWIMLATVAAATTRLRLGTAISPLPRYRPHLLAQTLTTLDIMSGGRVTLGVGLGAVAREYEAFGESSDPARHAGMVDEALEVITRLWSGESVTHHGTYYTAEDVQLRPLPVQRPRIPIWVGGESPRGLRRASRWDGWVASGNGPDGAMTKSPGDIAAAVARLRPLRAASDAPFEIALTGYSRPDDYALARSYADAGVTWWLESLHGFRGSVDDMLARVRGGPPRQ